jgi:hypothetical protein
MKRGDYFSENLKKKYINLPGRFAGALNKLAQLLPIDESQGHQRH